MGNEKRTRDSGHFFCVALANFALAGIVLTSRRYQPAHGWMAAMATAAGLWGVGVTVFLLMGSNNYELADSVVRAYYVVAAAIPLCLIELAAHFPASVNGGCRRMYWR